jgi:hypothetical protein
MKTINVLTSVQYSRRADVMEERVALLLPVKEAAVKVTFLSLCTQKPGISNQAATAFFRVLSK